MAHQARTWKFSREPVVPGRLLCFSTQSWTVKFVSTGRELLQSLSLGSSSWLEDRTVKGTLFHGVFFFFSTFPSKEGSLIHCNSGLEMLQLSLKQRTSSFSSGIPPVSPSPHPTRTLLQVQPQLSPPQLHPPPASRDPAAHPGGSNFFPLAKFVSNTHLPFQTFHMHLFFHFYAGRCLMLSLPFLSFHWNASSSSSPTWSDVS